MQGDRHFEYDDAGNLVRECRGKGGKLVTEYRYNLQNQLIQVIKQGQVITYKYDALGRRISKQDAFGETRFLWNGDVLLSETRNNIHKTYIYEPDSFRPLAFVQDAEVYYYHLDHLGTPQEMTDAQGEIVWSVRYKAYGNVVRKEVELVENNLRFQGQYFDKETGLHYNRFRYYDPDVGRFIHQDPIGLLGGDNLYQYVPNPVGWIDPFGLTSKEYEEKEKEKADWKLYIASNNDSITGHSFIILENPRGLKTVSGITMNGRLGIKGLIPAIIGKNNQAHHGNAKNLINKNTRYISYDITATQAKAAQKKMREVKVEVAKGKKYRLLTDQCATYACNIAKAADQKPPKSGIITNPKTIWKNSPSNEDNVQ